MTALFSARRRADDFEALLSRRPGTPLTERDAERFAALLDVVADLRAVPEATPRPEFVSSLRESLMAEADTVLVRRPAAPARLAMPVTARPRDRRLATLLGGAALVGATATMAVASQTALPGESLYGVKRGIESAQVRLADDNAARGHALLAQADTRLSEIEELARGDAGDARLIPATLEAFTEQSGDGVRSLLSAHGAEVSDADIEQARVFTGTSMGRLDALEPELPSSARDELLAAGRTLSDLDLEVSAACPACRGGITTAPDFLLTSLATDQPIDLLTGLDSDELTLETAPISGQDLDGITVPDELRAPEAVPTTVPTTSVTPSRTPTQLPTQMPTQTPTQTPTPTPTQTPTQAPTPTLPTPTAPVPTTNPDPTTDPDPTQPDTDLTQTVTDTTSQLTGQLDDLTGGALGGLTTGLDNATGGLIGEVTGTLDGLTGNVLGNLTGGLLPGR